jgi:hypothetical protein
LSEVVLDVSTYFELIWPAHISEKLDQLLLSRPVETIRYEQGFNGRAAYTVRMQHREQQPESTGTRSVQDECRT